MSRVRLLCALLCAAVSAACSDGTGPAPDVTVTRVTPTNGPLAGGTAVAITGANFPATVDSVRVGTGRLGSLVRVSATQVTGTTPAGSTAGAVDVAVYTTSAGSGTCPRCFVYFGAEPIVLHYDGTGWSTALEDVNGTRVSLASVWGATASAVFAVGGACVGADVLVRYDGTAWSQPPGQCVVFGSSGGLTSVFGISASDVFVVGRRALPPWGETSIRHYDGQQWTVVYGHSCSFSCFAGPRAVWSGSSTDAFVVGDSGLVLHYDGTSWNPQPSGTTEQLDAVWGVGPGAAVFAVGAGGTILYYDRSTWRALPSGTTQPLFAIWGTSANDVFAVGGAGTVLHYDGTTWTAQNSGSTQPLYGVWGSSGNAVFAVGDSSTILHCDGTTWTAQTTAASMTLRGVWGSSPANVFAVGAPRWRQGR